jgi:hypothetical protein
VHAILSCFDSCANGDFQHTSSCLSRERTQRICLGGVEWDRCKQSLRGKHACFISLLFACSLWQEERLYHVPRHCTVQEVRIFRYSGPCLDLIAELYPGTDSTIERNFTCSEAQSWQGEHLLFILILVDSTEWKFKYSDTYY